MFNVYTIPTKYLYGVTDDNFVISVQEGVDPVDKNHIMNWLSEWERLCNNTYSNKKYCGTILPIHITWNTKKIIQQDHFILDSNAIDLLNKNQLVVVFDMTQDSITNERLKIIHNTIAKYNIDYNSCVIANNYDLNFNNIRTAKFEHGLYFIPAFDKSIEQKILSSVNRPKKILSFCTKFSYLNQRYDMCRLLDKYNLREGNIITAPIIAEPKNQFELSLPWVYDHDNYKNIIVNLPKFNKAFTETYVSLILETFASKTNHGIDISEKTTNAIRHYHPFIMHSAPGSINYLQSLGYKTFNKWWDESYDNINDNNLRRRAIIKILQNINNMTVNQLQDMYVDMIPTLTHNADYHRNFMSNIEYLKPLLFQVEQCFANKR